MAVGDREHLYNTWKHSLYRQLFWFIGSCDIKKQGGTKGQLSGPLQVRQLPVSAFKRNGMQDQEHSKLLGTTNFLTRCPRDVSIECDICTNPVKVGDPAKVPPCTVKTALGCSMLKKKPIAVCLEDLLDDWTRR